MPDTWSAQGTAVPRRAIVFADLVESVRHYAHDEPGTVERWRRFSALVRERVAPQYGGRLVRTVGDGLMLEFDSAGNAVSAAFTLHRELARCEAGRAGHGGNVPAAMLLRIGLHMAEVVSADADLWGSGVNLAARLATLAQPQETVASAELRALLGDGVQADVHDLGLRYLKHYDEPVRAFRLAPPGSSPSRRANGSPDLRPALAVVPFTALPPDSEHDALGFAIADDVIASLARHPALRMLSRHSTAAVRGVQIDLARLRTLLGASFLLSGHYIVRGRRMRLSAELCELRGGEVLWSSVLIGDIDALFDGQDELVPHLVAVVSQHVLAHELARVRSLPMDSLASYSLLLGASGLLNSLAPDEFGRARELLDHLVERHPRHAAPHTLLSSWHIYKLLQGWTAQPRHERQQAMLHAELALEKEPQAPGALVARGVALVFDRGDHAAAGTFYRQALEVDPQHAWAWARLSETLADAGAHAQALAAVQRALTLTPLDPRRHAIDCFAARAAYMAEQFDEAVLYARESLRLHALHGPAHRMLVAALWMLGQYEAATRAADNYLRLLPGARVGSGASASTGEASLFKQALLKAGVPR